MFQQKLSTFLRPQVYRIMTWLDQCAAHLEAGFHRPLQRCLLCSSGETHNGALCAACFDDLPRVRSPCALCGGNVGSARLLQPLLSPAEASSLICGQCIRVPPVYDRARCGHEYEFPADELIRGIKYRAALHWIPPLAASARREFDRLLDGVTPSQLRLVPVPLHRSKACQRGFNQAKSIAAELARPRQLELASRVLFRAKATRPQAALAPDSRRENMREAFAVDQCRLQQLRKRHGVTTLVLIDDVMTTGSTADECARVLKAADPALTILAFALARKSQC